VFGTDINVMVARFHIELKAEAILNEVTRERLPVFDAKPEFRYAFVDMP
jgi:hypothetical protein